MEYVTVIEARYEAESLAEAARLADEFTDAFVSHDAIRGVDTGYPEPQD
jgi:hypothetical protein